MSPSLSTKVLLFSGISLLQISTNCVDLAEVFALTLTRGTGMSRCKEALVLESFQENPSESEQNSEDLQQNHDPADAEAGAGNANSPSVCETTDLATGRTSSNLNEAGMSDSYAKMLESNAKVLKFMNTANLSVRERAYLRTKHLLIDLSLNFVDAARLSVPEGGQDAAFEIAEDGAQETSAASTLVRAQRWKTVGDLKTWLASVRGKSKFLIDVFLSGTEMQLEDTQTLSQIGDELRTSSEASNNTGPVNLFVLERVFCPDDLVQDFLEQYSSRLKNFTEIESSEIKKIEGSVGNIKQKNGVTVRIKRDDIDTSNTKTSSDDDSSTFFEITFVRQRTSYFSIRGGVHHDGTSHRERFSVYDDLYIVFKGATRQSIYYDVTNDSWSMLGGSWSVRPGETPWSMRPGETRVEVNEDVSFKNNIGFRAQANDHTLNIPDLGEMTWAKLFTTFLIYGSFKMMYFADEFPDYVKELSIPAWEDFAVEFTRYVPDSQRLITRNDAGNVKIYDSDRQYYEKVEEKVGENWEGLRIADVTFKQT